MQNTRPQIKYKLVKVIRECAGRLNVKHLAPNSAIRGELTRRVQNP